MNKWILPCCAALLLILAPEIAHADLKQKIKDKIEDGIFEAFAGELAQLPGLSHLIAQVESNQYQLVSTNQNAGLLDLGRNPDLDKATLSRQANGTGIAISRRAYLAPGTYWLKASPKDKKKQAITRKVYVQAKRRNIATLTFWEKGRKSFPLEIVTQPTTAKVRVMNIGPKYEFGMPLAAGDYQLEVSEKGYKTRNLKVRLDHNQNQFGVILQSIDGKAVTADTSSADDGKASTKASEPEQSSQTAASEQADEKTEKATDKAKKKPSTTVEVMVWVLMIGGFIFFCWLTYKLFTFIFTLMGGAWRRLSA
ncbi:hypothetical protein SHLO109777_07035 [Shewanella loihica]|uniref:PEGA domain-containing protein n=1 Tax=Shewanella loihica (strain ATCC BAA-1088 / PV-4) TaxID=323850 RepID=A3QHF9_SHELP|nr:hypothetical protein [Shewanella loihica]ABO24907.1 hypothetical protein Shew_3041 [Shewanella loihica PV-4]